HFRRGDLEESIQLQRRLVELAETGQYDRWLVFDSHLLGDRPYLNLAVCLHQLAGWMKRRSTTTSCFGARRIIGARFTTCRYCANSAQRDRVGLILTDAGFGSLP